MVAGEWSGEWERSKGVEYHTDSPTRRRLGSECGTLPTRNPPNNIACGQFMQQIIVGLTREA